MIVVIADDLTGAAEIGGIGLRHGLSVEIVTAFTQSYETDLLVVCTDTRSMNEPEAVQTARLVITQLVALDPTLIFKKIDSVLRGHILTETKMILEATGLNRALIIGGNPSLGRTIVNGNYFLYDEPVHLSSFSNDPEFPVTSSDVQLMLRANGIPLSKLKQHEALPEQGIAIGDIMHPGDFAVWANAARKEVLLTGTSLFFSAVLEAAGLPAKPAAQTAETITGSPVLFVCGTTFHNSVAAIKEIADANGPVCYIPVSILLAEDPDDAAYTDFADQLLRMLNWYQKAIIAFDPKTILPGMPAVMLRTKMAIAVKRIYEKAPIQELIIEGGSTAAALLKKLHFSRFQPVQELKPGVIRMQVEGVADRFVTMKPGSYPWPDGLWNFQQPQQATSLPA